MYRRGRHKNRLASEMNRSKSSDREVLRQLSDKSYTYATIDSPLDSLLMLDRSGRILDWNDKAEDTFGLSLVDVYEKFIWDVLFSKETKATQCPKLEGFLRSLWSGVVCQKIELSVLHRDGYDFPIEVGALTVSVDGTTEYYLVLRDISDNNRIQKSQGAQFGVTQILNSASSLVEAAPKLLETVCEVAGWDIGDLFVVDEETQQLHCADFWHSPGVDVPNFEMVSRKITFKKGQGLPGRVWETQQPSWIGDLARDPNFPRAHWAQMDNIHGGFAFPIVLGSEVLGVIEFFSSEVGEPDEKLKRLFASIGSQIGQFIERKKLESDLRNLELMRQREDFMAALTHDLKNPLLGANRILELFTSGKIGSLTEEQQEILCQLRQSNSSLIDLLRNLVDVYRLERDTVGLNIESNNMTSLIKLCISDLKSLCAESGTSINFKNEAGAALYCDFDLQLVRRVVQNLLDNAQKFAQPGGTIDIALRSTDSDVEFHVKDNGPGITPEEHQRIFQKFWQGTAGKRYVPGTGLGLYLCKQIVETHNGTISCESVLGEGTTFSVCIPLKQSKLAVCPLKEL